jgi:CheY-like chemotaxis protein
MVVLQPAKNVRGDSDDDSTRWLEFSVKDTGVGIDAERQAAIFEPFNQADGTTSRNYGGTGLGLSITRQLAELLGGQLELVSKPGSGSTFSVVFPVTQASGENLDSGRSVTPAVTDLKERKLIGGPAQFKKTLLEADEGPVDDPMALSGMRVLVADNDMRNLYTLSGLLESAGAATSTATNTAEVLSYLAKNQKFDLILSGLFEAKSVDDPEVKELHDTLKNKGTPLMCLSRGPGDNSCFGCPGCMAQVALQRPFPQSDLVAEVAAFLPATIR